MQVRGSRGSEGHGRGRGKSRSRAAAAAGAGAGAGANLETLSAGGSFWQLGEELEDQLLAAAVQQPVSLIQHKELDSVCGQLARLNEVHDTPCTHIHTYLASRMPSNYTLVVFGLVFPGYTSLPCCL